MTHARPLALVSQFLLVPFKFPSSAQISVSEFQATFSAAKFRLYLYVSCFLGVCISAQLCMCGMLHLTILLLYESQMYCAAEELVFDDQMLCVANKCLHMWGGFQPL